ncbi:MAG TPA: HIT domain-containing protein [Pyrinomonadaceae bacterium]|nr:HIT domain-containing protein [Pyrinomonadaceae bacterium]
MDILWSPWRYDYIKSGSGEAEAQQQQQPSCVFCALKEETGDDESKSILHRASYNFVVLNIYPYISGHLLIVPYEHLGELDAAPKETTDELMDLAKRAQTLLREAYGPHGFNLGMNLGRAAGAGVADHIHLHIMPRWVGDTNFMSTIGETRVIPEDLSTTYHKLHGKF